MLRCADGDGSPQGELRSSWPYVAGAGQAICIGSAIAAAVGGRFAHSALLVADVGVPAAHGVAAFSLLARARTATGRVRLRLMLLGVSTGAAGVHEFVLRQLTALLESSTGVLYRAIEMLAVAGIAIALGMGVAALVVAASEGGMVLIWLRRLLDGWMIAGSLFTLGWVFLLQRADLGGDVLRALSDLGRVVADILVLGLLLVMRFAMRPGERAAVNFGAVGLTLFAVSDMLRIFSTEPVVATTIPLTETCSMTGMFLIAAAPWMPGGGSALGVHRRQLPVAGVVAAFVPVVVCAVAVAAHLLAGGRLDAVTLLVGGSVLLTLSARAGVAHAENLCLAREVAVREDHFRTLVQSSSDVIAIAGQDCVLLYISPSVRQVFGYRPEDLLGTHLALLIHHDDVAPLTNTMGKLREEGGLSSHSPSRRVSCRIRAADGQWRHTESTISRHANGLIINSRDVSERAALQARLEHLAFHDTLTGLPNRALFADRLKHALAKRSAHRAPPAVLFLDLDGFKSVNDSAGHAVGDELLIQAALRLQAAVRAGDTVARLGGDEFAALLEGEAGLCGPRTREVAERLLSALSKPYCIGGTEAVVAASIGIAVATPEITPDELMRRADLAMYAAKAAGRGRIEVHQPPTYSSESPGSTPADNGSCVSRGRRDR
ncbi:diguanylate cyclase domain-containing protein [Streptomyces sp. 8N616]|uniref:diguanylate cyclase domain-containing protein n=1 Tax=Streptomyces sp. 8N616 TaxID=3457414 RepID=UPI003FCF27CF